MVLVLKRFLMVNDVLQNTKTKLFQRILWIDIDYSSCYMIELFTPKLKVTHIPIAEIELAIENGVLVLTNEDPTAILIDENAISEKATSLLEKAHEIVQYIAAPMYEPSCFYGKSRSKKILESVQIFDTTEKTVLKYLRKYWQGGKAKHSLLCNLKECGGKGKIRNPGNVKRGKPHNLTYIDGKTYGMNVDADTIKIFNLACRRYFLKTKKTSLMKSYNLMKMEFYSKVTEDGIKAIDSNLIPSVNQYKYWYYSQRNIIEEKIARDGERKMNLNYRKLNSDSIFETLGPGFRYQIDATIADLFLVNRIDRTSVIGRPVVYLIIDVFSRLIVGVHVCLEGPSWNSASSALYNCMEDKVSYCKRCGIDIQPEDWPAFGKPEVLLADRGELVGNLPEPIITNLKIGIENTPSYMGCAKGIVEQYFHVINTEIKHWLPGEVKKQYRERGERDYRLDAVLDIVEFTQIIIYSVLHRNKTLLQNYPVTQEMLDQGVPKKPTPIEVWNWGKKHRAGGLRSETRSNLLANLMRHKNATIDAGGIRFEGMYYTSALAEFKQWYRIASLTKTSEVEVVYDNRDISTIFLLNAGKLLECNLRPENSFTEFYNGKSWEEVVDYHFLAQAENTVKADAVNNEVVDFNSKVKSVIDIAKEKKGGLKNNVKDTKNSRKLENDNYRAEQSLSNHGKSEVTETPAPTEMDKSNGKGSRKKMLEQMSMMGAK